MDLQVWALNRMKRYAGIPSISSQNHEDIFHNNERIWFVDDSNVYRVIVDKTIEGKTIEYPINGAAFMFNPITGDFFMKIVHSSEWAGKKSFNQAAQSKGITAQKIALELAVKSLPVEERPKQFVPAHTGWIDPLEVGRFFNSGDYIPIRCTRLNLPFHACLKIEIFSDLIMNATKPRMSKFNLYDDWLLKSKSGSSSRLSSYEAFSRLILILRALEMNEQAAKMLINKLDENTKQPYHIWPSLSDDQWMKVEIGLRDLIISDFVKKNNIMNVSSLTQLQIRDIILGGNVKISPTQRTDEYAKKKKKVKASAPSSQLRQRGLAKLALWKHKIVSFWFCQNGSNLEDGPKEKKD